MSQEWFDLVDLEGSRVGRALRSECHGNPELLHQAVHVLVKNAKGELFLQKRSMEKDVQPGKWDMSVGGHVDEGEEPSEAAVRELSEELGVTDHLPVYHYHYIWESDIEREYIRTFSVEDEGPFSLQPEEIEEGRFWTCEEIDAALGTGMFTPNFEFEWPQSRLLLQS